MKYTIYKCDECNKILSDENKIAKTHISINIAKTSGWVGKPDKDTPQWKQYSYISGIFQFCNEQCLARHFQHLSNTPLTPPN